ncbi:hypothetical protein ACFFS4_30085 [Kutzneria kofuensis]|uniref:Uncharacterized protein n=1 Tax=Kutzneria kofuensis TaxID=103725 RepID=A0A7W9NF68_9PSEU|nr:hypothetical protein [Kutzneria kofuensis]MBB5889688.1 hypothetical protein [Kutzneria kofuensis]
MADFVTPLLAALGTIIAALGGPTVAGALQNRRDGRLRASFTSNKELLKELDEKPSLLNESQKQDLQALVNEQAAALVSRERARLNKRREWSNLGVVIFLLCTFGWIPVWMWFIQTWWSWIIFGLVGIFLAACTITGTIQTFRPSESSRKRKSTVNE